MENPFLVEKRLRESILRVSFGDGTSSGARCEGSAKYGALDP
jgi:hypothetical protein